MKPYYETDGVQLYLGDCLKVLAAMPDASVDSMVTDPPAGIAFMGRAWDEDKGGRRQWIAWLTEVMEQAYRVLKPGGHALVWALPRTSHWTATALEDAGFEIRDCVVHLYGSGFPKSLDVSKAIDKAAGAEREVVGVAADFARDGSTRKTDGSHVVPHAGQGGHRFQSHWGTPITAAATDEAKQWDGWGTSLKPGSEHWWLVRKPLVGTVANTVLTYGTGALNIGATRVSTDDDRSRPPRTPNAIYGAGRGTDLTASESHPAGRWPTNAVFTHSASCAEGQACQADCPVGDLDRQSGATFSSGGSRGQGGGKGAYSVIAAQPDVKPGFGDRGGASRFFPTFRYQAKAPTSERPKVDGIAHPTAKSLGLMKWMCRLATPPGGIVLDPFAGSGTTLEAALAEGFQTIGIEQEPDYLPLIMSRLSKPVQTGLFEGVL